MKVDQVLAELKKLGNESTKNIFLKHGAKEPFFGVKVADLKIIRKKIKGDQQLALDLYDSGNSDAMYLAGLAADGSQMSKRQIQKWANGAYWYMISEYTVPWIASESEQGWEIALEWIDSKKENIASTGWATLAAIVSMRPDEELDVKAVKSLLKRVEKEIHGSQNRVRYTMNGFVISVAAYVVGLHDEAVAAGKRIGRVSVDMGGTACKVPFAPEYIEKIKARRAIGKKKKTAKC